MAGFELKKPLRMTDFTFQSGHYSPFTNDFATFRDHFIGITPHFLTHFLSEAIS